MNYGVLISAIQKLHASMLSLAVQAVDRSLVLRNWLIGAWLVEFQQKGEDRAAYGTRLLQNVAADLARSGVTGCAVRMLERMREFYLVYPQLLIDLKTRAFRHGDAGQMNYYLNYWKDQVMQPGDQPPVGLILCTNKNQTRVDYATGGLDRKMFVSRYLNVLPSTEILHRLIEEDAARWLQNHPADK